MLFNSSRTYDFPPELSLTFAGDSLNVVEKTRLLGLQISTGCQIFHSGLTKNQSRDIENIQKKSLKIILGKLYSCYEEACTLLSCEPLSDRRDSLCLTFITRM